MKGNRLASGALLVLLALATTACDEFLDVNTNPNQPQTAPPDVVLPAVLATFSTGVLGSYPSTMGAEWTQQISFNSNNRGLARYDKYEMRDVDSGVLWDRIYGSVLSETKTMFEQAEQDEEWAYSAISKIMHAWTLTVASDVWGPIPNSAALDPSNRKPAYDEQKAVYADALRLLDEAIEELPRPNFPLRIPSINDLLYNGDLGRWLKLAHTLKAQLHLHQIYAPGESPQARAQQILSELPKGFSSNLDDADFRYPGVTVTGTTPPGPQPWYIARVITAYRVSQFYVDLLNSRADPRLAFSADAVTQSPPPGGRRGHKNGDPEGPAAQFSRVANLFALDTASFTWLSYAQAKFIEAEARLVANGAAAADASYRDAMRANMEKMRVSAAAINTYINARPNLSTLQNPLAEIIREKYIANFLKFEAWNDWRRTGYPALVPVAGALTSGIPQRFPNPASELLNNAASLQATGIPSGLSGMTVKVWWATTGPR
jgi:hypothetical protein